MELTKQAARALMVAALGLDRRPVATTSKQDVLTAIRRMGALQIDTINVVSRSPYLVLWSRLGGYDPRWLDDLLEEGEIFEYWSHEASFVPGEDYPLYRRVQLDRGGLFLRHWVRESQEVIDRVLDYVRLNGPTRSADFTRTDGQKGGWWSWKPEKRALEVLFATGDLMIARRQSFQRVYDLRERVRPDWRDEEALSAEQVKRTLALRAVRCLGIATARWVHDYFRTERAGMPALLESLAESGELREARVDGWSEPGYVHSANLELAELARSGELRPSLTTLLSPFDPLVWHRERAQAVFDFDYRIECYTPEPLRKYGYFALPILRRGELVGRVDAKAHRREGRFEIRSLYVEPGVEATDALVRDLAEAIATCAAWHGTPEVEVVRSEIAGLEDALGELAQRPGQGV